MNFEPVAFGDIREADGWLHTIVLRNESGVIIKIEDSTGDVTVTASTSVDIAIIADLWSQYKLGTSEFPSIPEGGNPLCQLNNLPFELPTMTLYEGTGEDLAGIDSTPGYLSMAELIVEVGSEAQAERFCSWMRANDIIKGGVEALAEKLNKFGFKRTDISSFLADWFSKTGNTREQLLTAVKEYLHEHGPGSN